MRRGVGPIKDQESEWIDVILVVFRFPITTFYGTLGLYGSGCMTIYHLATLFLTAVLIRLIRLDCSGGTVSGLSISRGRMRKRRRQSTFTKAKVDCTWVEFLQVYQPLVFPVQQ